MNKDQIIKIVILVLAVVALGYVVFLYMKKSGMTEGFSSGESVQPSEGLGLNSVPASVNGEASGPVLAGGKPNDCFPKEQLKASDLLPGGNSGSDTWAKSVPSGQGELGDQNFLTAGYHVGVNTVGQSLRNANRQLRSEPPNPQVKVSPWLQATIEPDTNRKPLEIGPC